VWAIVVTLLVLLCSSMRNIKHYYYY